MNKFALAGLGAVCLLTAGCPHNEYIVDLAPRGASIDRQVTFFRRDGTNDSSADFPTNELARIAACYPPERLQRDAKKYTVSGTFSEALPPDLGGSGTYTNIQTVLGEAGFYAERFRGSDAPAEGVARRLRAADQLADLVLGWSKAALGSEPNYSNLHDFLDGDFRKDLRNLAVYSWTADVAAHFKPGAEEEFAGRVLQYLVERHYLQFSEVPALLQALDDDFDGVLATFVRRTFAAKLAGTNTAAAPSDAVARVADREVLEQSWHDFLAGTPEYKELLRKWEEQSGSDGDARRPEPWDVIQEPLSDLVQFGFSGEPDRLTVRLSLPARPLHTNGRWDESAKSVVWEHALEPDVADAALPPYCYAIWSRPNEEYQRQRFGEVRLQGDDLLKYCLWYASLDPRRAAEWDALLNRLSPGEAIRKKLEAFRFSEAQPGGSYPLAIRVLPSIVDALAGNSESGPD